MTLSGELAPPTIQRMDESMTEALSLFFNSNYMLYYFNSEHHDKIM